MAEIEKNKKANENTEVAFDTENMLQYAKWGVVAVVIFAAIFGGINKFSNDSKQSNINENKDLGQAYVYMTRKQNDSAIIFINDLLASPHAKIVSAKANLLLGQAQYNLGKYNESLTAYKKVVELASDVNLLYSGAQHGIGASYMQLGEDQSAIASYETFIQTFMKKTDQDRFASDLSVAVPNVLWKLALLYKKSENNEKVKEKCLSLIKFYGKNLEAQNAARLLRAVS